MSGTHSTELALQVLRQYLAGNLELSQAMPVLRELSGSLPAASLDELRRELAAGSTAQREVAEAIDRRLLLMAGQAHEALARGQFAAADWPELAHLPAPPMAGWTDGTELAAMARELALHRRDLACVGELSETCPRLAAAVAAAWMPRVEAFRQQESRWEYLGDDTGAAPELELLAQRCQNAASPEEARAALDRLLLWPGSAAAKFIARLELPEPLRPRAMELLMLRFGRKTALDWMSWRRFLLSEGELRTVRLEACRRVVEAFGPELRLIRAEESGAAPPELMAAVMVRARETSMESFLQRWRGVLLPEEAARLPGAAPVASMGAPVLPPPRRLGEEAALPPPRRLRLGDTPATQPAAGKPTEPPAPPRPTVWEEHVQPLLLEYWYLVAGLLLMIAGASLLAYLTWDKPTVWRFTIMPAMLFLFTAGLAELGNWLGRRHEDLRSTGLMLRGGAMALLPVNAMVVGVVSRDRPGGLALAGGLTVLYLGLIGGALWRWCGQVLGRRGRLMAAALLGFNALVPLAACLSIGGVRGELAARWLALGFYLAVAGATWSVRRSLAASVEPGEPRRELWFGGLTLAVTCLEVVVWTHLFLGQLPPVHWYGLLTILLGDLLFMVERHLGAERERPDGFSGESFLGFAVVLAGVLMGMGEVGARIIGLTAAGIVWLRQAKRRPGTLHHWIGVSLVVLGAAAVGTWEAFPKSAQLNLLPALGIAIGLLLGLWRMTQVERDERLHACLTDFQPVVLLLTAVVAIFSQWRLDSVPWMTGLVLVLIAGFFASRAVLLERLPWLHAAMALLAVALPYLGFVDFARQNRDGNTMALGLGLLSAAWLILLARWNQPLLRQARSTVPACYGIVALAAMVLRVLAEDRPIEGFADYAGPLLVAATLIVTAYHSRSLGPGFAAAAILAVLFPELKARFHEQFEAIGWGSGLGSAGCAAGLLALAFLLRRWPRLQHLDRGDPWSTDTPFPWRRHDYTLFTIPLLGTVLFLAAKTCTVTHWRVLEAGIPGWKTVAGLAICAIVWPAAAVYLKGRRGAWLLPHLGWATLLLATFSGQQRWDGYLDLRNLQYPVLWAGVVLQATWFALMAWRERWPEGVALLGHPYRRVLDTGCQALGWYLAVALFVSLDLEDGQWLAAFLAAQLVWHGLRRRTFRQGAALAALGTAVLWGLPGDEWKHFLLGLGAIQAVQLALEPWPRRYLRLRPVLAPLQVAALAGVVVTWFTTWGFLLAEADDWRSWATLALLMVTARAQRSALLALLGAGYLIMLLDWGNHPWELALIGLGLTALPFAARWIHGRWRPGVAGRYPLGRLTGRSDLWWLIPGMAAGLLATSWQLGAVYGAGEIYDWRQTVAPWAAAAALVLSGIYRRQFWLWAPAGVLLALGNVVAVDLWWGAWLRGRGLGHLHTICLGLGWTLLEAIAARAAVRRWGLAGGVGQFGRVVAASILAILAANYALFRDVAAITAMRLAVSGAMALSAGLYFRFELSRGEGLTDRERQSLTGLYHFGVTLAIWCMFLLVPPLRSARLALVALAMAPVYFWVRAEWGRRETRLAYAHSAEVLAFLVLALYAANAAFQMIAFPELRPTTDHYHVQAPVAIGLGVLLLRLQAMLPGGWASFYGGLAVLIGGYFGVTAWPGLSPFDAPMPAAWAAAAMAHLLIVATHRRSPLRAWIQQLGAIDDLSWDGLRRGWGRWLLAGSQVAILLGVLDYRQGSWQVTPLLAAAGSIFIHQGVLGGYRSYLVAGGVELLVALHADFLLPEECPGLIPAARVIWVIVGLWAVVVLGWPGWRRWLVPRVAGLAGAGAGGLVFLHVLWHGPASDPGLAAMWALLVLALLTPMGTRRPTSPAEALASAIVLAMPVWLMYWHQLAATGDAWISFRAVLAAAVTGLAVGECGRWLAGRSGHSLEAAPAGQPRLWQQTLGVLEAEGRPLATVVLWATTGVLGMLLIRGYLPGETGRGPMMALAGGWSALAWGWHRENVQTASVQAGFMTELAVVGAAAAVRRVLWTMGAWNAYYDVWASLAVSTCLSGLKQVVHRQERSRRMPLVVSLFALPAATLVWVMWQGLGTDVALVVIGLHCVTFTWLGAGNRQSPYNVVAVMHFVAFVALLFWSRLELRFLHAYTIPVGIGILVLLQLHGDRIDAATRNGVRLAVMLAMLGSSGYYVLADTSHAFGFHATMLLLCIGAMLMGGWLRVRLYLGLGMAGLILDVAVLLTRAIGQFDTTIQKACIGILLLGLGSALVGGTAYYKAHRESIQARLEEWKGRLAAWE